MKKSDILFSGISSTIFHFEFPIVSLTVFFCEFLLLRSSATGRKSYLYKYLYKYLFEFL